MHWNIYESNSNIEIFFTNFGQITNKSKNKHKWEINSIGSFFRHWETFHIKNDINFEE